MPYDTSRGTYQINPAAPHNLASQNLCVSTTAPRIAGTQGLAHRRLVSCQLVTLLGFMPLSYRSVCLNNMICAYLDISPNAAKKKNNKTFNNKSNRCLVLLLTKWGQERPACIFGLILHFTTIIKMRNLKNALLKPYRAPNASIQPRRLSLHRWSPTPQPGACLPGACPDSLPPRRIVPRHLASLVSEPYPLALLD